MTIERISINSAGERPSSSASASDVSRSGRYVVYVSDAPDSVGGHAGSGIGVFIRDMATGIVERIDRAIGGGPTDGSAFEASISADGRYVTYVPITSNLAGALDDNRTYDIFVYDRVTRETKLVSASADDKSASGQSDDTISSNGLYASEQTLDDWVYGTAGADELIYDAGAQRVRALEGNDIVRTGDGDDTVEGGEGRDKIWGGVGNDILDGGAGADFIYAGAGNDSVYGGSEGDVIMEADPAVDGTILVTGNDHFFGGDGDDHIDSREGSDELHGEGGNDTLYSGDNSAKLFGGEGNDFFSLGGGDDEAHGGAGDDRIISSANGMKLLVGGSGNDTYERVGSNATIVEEADGGHDKVDIRDLANYQIGANIEDATAVYSSIAVTIHGNELDNDIVGSAGADFLHGGDGNDRLEGWAGRDTLTGGKGDDIYIANQWSGDEDVIVELAGEGTDTVQTGSTNYTLGDNLENLFAIDSTLTRTLTGNSVDNVIKGAQGNDTLYGLEGDDTLHSGNGTDVVYGGTGNDTYVLGFGQKTVNELAGEGTDEVITDQLTFTLTANVENLTSKSKGTYSHSFQGNELDNRIEGGSNADTLLGLGGNDHLIGGGAAAGGDRLDGGDGTDRAYFAGNRADYTITRLADGTVHVKEAGTSGVTHSAIRVEEFSFADGVFTEADLFNSAPTANDDVTSATEGEHVNLWPQVLANDSDPDAGDSITIESVDTAGMLGRLLAFDPVTQTLHYSADTPAFDDLAVGQTRTDSFTYTIRDSQGASSTATVTITVTGTNDGPVAVADAGTVAEDAATANLWSQLLGNDSDVDAGDSFTIVSVDSTGTLGRLIFDPSTQTLRYAADTPAFDDLPAGETRTDTFSYTIRDSHGATSTQTVTMTVTGTSNGPVANPDAIAVDEDATTGNLWSTLLGNDFGEGAVIAQIDTSNTLGGITFNWFTKTLTYVANDDLFDPLEPGETMIDYFTYTIIDANGETSTATVAVTVRGVANDAASWIMLTENADSASYDLGIQRVRALGGHDYVVTGAGDDVVEGGAGSDRVYGGADNDKLYGGDDDDMLFGEAGNDELYGGLGNDTLVAGGGADRLFGDAGDDTLRGGAGLIIVDGGLGTDTAELDFSGETAGIAFKLPDIAAYGSVVVAGTTIRGVERLVFRSGSGNDEIVGGAGDDELHGGGGNDTLVSGDGNDKLYGGEGDDELGAVNYHNDVVSPASGVVHLDGGAGLDTATIDRRNSQESIILDMSLSPATVQTFGNGSTLVNAERLHILSGSGNDHLTGGAYDDILVGGAGDDFIKGGSGDSILYGDGYLEGSPVPAEGTDTAHLDFRDATESLTFRVADNLAGEVVLTTTAGSTRVAGFEEVIFHAGSGNDMVEGGAHNDTLIGGAGDDMLVGGGGHDGLIGGAGLDTLIGGQGEDILDGGQGNDLLDGGAGDDVLIGRDGNDDLISGDGDDTLFGGAGDDSLFAANSGPGGLIEATGRKHMDGGAGTDFVYIDRRSATQGFNLDLAAAAGVVQTLDDGSTIVNVEQGMVLGGAGNDVLKGGIHLDSLFGGAGDDVIEGGQGDSFLWGDTYGEGQGPVAEAGFDRARLDFRDATESLTFRVADNLAGEVILTGSIGGGSTSIAGFEEVIFHAGSGDDMIEGGAHNDTLIGGAGDDMLVGGGGHDGLIGGAGLDTLIGGAGEDILDGGQGNDALDGGAGDDVLIGRDGEDILAGMAGNDRLIGGAGTDTAVFTGTRKDYKFELQADGSLGVHEKGKDGSTDIVSEVELFRFADGTFTLEELAGLNSGPKAVADRPNAGEDGTTSLNVLANDTDSPGDKLTLVSVNGTGATGTVAVGARGTVSYTASAAHQALRQGQTATDTFSYTIRDEAGLTSTASVTVTIVGANDAPVAVSDSHQVNEDGSMSLWDFVLSNDHDPDLGDTRSIVAVDVKGTEGQVQFDAATRTLVYTANAAAFDALSAGQTAIDTFTYTIRDAAGVERTATVTMTIVGALNEDDWIYGTEEADRLLGQAIDDYIQGRGGNDEISGKGGNDHLHGGSGDDIITGGTGENRLFGEDGNDIFGGDEVKGLHHIDGGWGQDTLVTMSSGDLVRVDLESGFVEGGFYDGSIFIDLENLTNGSRKAAVEFFGDWEANVLTGGREDDLLVGRGGNDTLNGGRGNDRLVGGRGIDTLSGGDGDDVLVFGMGDIQGDQVLDFGRGDQLRFEGVGQGAFLTNNGNQWTLHYGSGLSETFTMNVTNVADRDIIFG